MIGRSRFRRLAGIIAATAVLSTGGAIAAVAPASAATVNSQFDFCNNTGKNGAALACFTANLHFDSAYKFTLSSVVLTDKYCDNRSVFATPTDQSGYWEQGYINGIPYWYKNSLGCNHSETYATQSFSGGGRIQYVVIKLFAANTTSNSTVVSSLKHYNPYY